MKKLFSFLRCLFGLHKFTAPVKIESAIVRACQHCETFQVLERPTPFSNGGWNTRELTTDAQGRGYVRGTNGNLIRVL
jgi:hypothetical protein